MKDKDTELELASPPGAVLGDYDDADMFGLDEYGQPTGLNPNWGALGVTGAGTLTTLAVQQFSTSPKMQRASEAIGLGVATAAAGALMVSKKTRAAGWAGLFAAIASHGPRLVADYLSKANDAAVSARAGYVTAKKAGGVAPAAPVQGHFAGGRSLMGVEVQEIPAFSGNPGLGLVMPEATRALGNAPHPELPQLVGTHLSQAQREVSLLGGPTLMSIAGHFGSTHFNKAA